MSLNIWFAGTSYFAGEILKDSLQNPDCHIIGVLTQPDRKSGRGKKILPSPVKEIALSEHLPLVQPNNLNSATDVLDHLVKPDLCIVVAYGVLLPKWFLNYPLKGCINIHASLLPRWRGAAPIQRAIAAGDKTSGIGIMQMDEGLDTGDIWHEETVEIKNNDNSSSLTEKLITAGKQGLRKTLPIIENQSQKPTAQKQTGITYAHKLSKEEAAINWQESATIIARKIRAFNPTPIAHTKLVNDTLRIHQASVVLETSPQPAGTIIKQDKQGFYVSCGQNILCIEILQLPGKKALHASQLTHSKNWLGEKLL